MTWKFWCSFSIILNLLIIVTEANENVPSLIIQNIIPKKINPDVLRIDIKQTDETVLYKLEFKKTKGILANSKTPVLKYFDNIENREKLVKFYPDYEVMQGIGDFSFYHDIDNKASAVLYSDSDGFYLDGIISDSFRLNRFPVNYLNNVLKRPENHIIKESGSDVENLKENTLSKLDKTVQNVNAFYPELLIILDYDLITSTSKIQAIKKQLVYWNAVDMLFASMKYPEIYLNIAGFILPSSKHAFEFLEKEPGSTFLDFYDAIEGVETLFYKYRDQISFDYDILVAMTGSKLCVKPTKANPVMNCINGFSDTRPDITNKFDDEHGIVDSSVILHFDNEVSSYTNGAQKIGYMFTGEFTQKKEIKKCPGIMEEYYRRGKFSLSWSTCTQQKVADYLQSPKAKGLKNFPKYLSNEKKSQPLSVVTPKPPKKWWNRLSNWVFNRNKNKNNEINDAVITTQPSVRKAAQLTITTEAFLPKIPEKVYENDKLNTDLKQEFTTSETDLIAATEPFSPEIIEKVSKIPENDKLNIDLKQEFTTSETSFVKETNLIATTEPFSPEIIEKVSKITEKIPEIIEPNDDLEQKSIKSKEFLDNPSPNVYSATVSSPGNDLINDINTAPTSPSAYSSVERSSANFIDEEKKNEYLNSESRIGEEEINASEPVNNYSDLRIEYLSSTTAKLLTEKHVTVSSEKPDVSVVDSRTDVVENNLEKPTENLKLNQQKVSDEAPLTDSQNYQESLPDGQKGAATSDEVPPTLKQDEKLTNLSPPVQKNTLEFFGRRKRFQSLPVKREFRGLNNFMTTTETAIEQYSTQNNFILNENTSNNYESTTIPIIEEYSNQNKSAQSLNTSAPLTLSSRTFEVNSSSTELAQDDSTTAVSELISVTESLVSSIKSTSPTEPLYEKEKIKLDVALELNININDKNIQTLKKNFHDVSLNQENGNITDTDDKVIRNMIDYLLKKSDK